MKVVSTEALTKLIQLVKSAFIKVDDAVEVTEIDTETPSEITLATVATSGDYDDLINKPTIPTATSDLTNDSGFITSSALTPYVLSADLASVATSGSYNDLSDKPNLAAKADVDLSNINPTSAKKAEITSWGMPDYTSGVSKSANVDYTADSNGFIIAVPTAQSGQSRLKIKINDTEFMFFQGYFGTDYDHLSNGCIPIAKNSTYKITLLTDCDVRFFPCIGG